MQGQSTTLEAAVECLDRLISKMKPETSSKMRSAVVALYSSDKDNRLRFSTQICLVHLDFDRQLKTAFLRFYHLEHLSLLLEIELYYCFMNSYQLKNKENNLWGFDLWSTGTFCIQFRNQLEGEIFAKKLEQAAPKREALLELSRRQVQEELRKRNQNSLFGKFKSIFRRSNTQKEESVVIQVVKSNSIIIDKEGNFQTQTLSPEWEEIIRRSGLQISDMKDKNIAKIVLEETIIYQAKKAAEADPSFLTSAGLTSIQDLEQQAQVQQKPVKDASMPLIAQNALGQNQNILDFEQKDNERKKTSNTLAESLPIPSFILPPPPPPLDLPPPIVLTAPCRTSVRRENLLQEIRNNKVKLKPVKTNEGKFQIDASSLNKEERMDVGSQIRKRLQARKVMLKSQVDSDDD